MKGHAVHPRAPAFVLASVVALVVGAGGCSGDDGATGSGDETTTTTAPAAAATGGPATTPPPTSTPVSATPPTPATPVAPSGPACASLPPDGEASIEGMADDPAGVAAANNPELSMLATAVADAALVDTLNSPGPFTIFAPVNAAFAALDPAELEEMLADHELLTEILTLHVVEGRSSVADLAAAGSVTALGGDLALTTDAGALVVNGAARIVCGDIATANATVHLIDAVLTPPVAEEAVGGSQLYSVDLATGTATELGSFGRELGVLGLAIAPGGGTSTVYGLTDAAELITFDAAEPSSPSASITITGVAAGSTLLAIDVRPADGRLVGLSDASVVYTIDAATGIATPVGTGIDPPLEDPGFGLDVDPAADRIRLDAVTGQNLRIDPATGAVGVDPVTEEASIDGILVYAEGDANATVDPRVVAIGYTNPVANASETQLYVIDAATGTLAIQNTPDDGVLTTVGPLGIEVTDGASFDIAATGEALLASPG